MEKTDRYTKRQIEEALGYWAGTLLAEDKAAFKAKFGKEPGFDAAFGKYWDVVRHRVNGPEKDVEYWQNRDFSEFKSFVDGFDANSNRSSRRQDGYREQAEKAGAELFAEMDGYEAWHVPTYEAAKILGRFYKGRSANWCISTDNPVYFRNYTGRGIKFAFLVKKDPDGGDYDKMALQIDPKDGDCTTVWNMPDQDDASDDDAILSTVDKAVEQFVRKYCPRKSVSKYSDSVKHGGRALKQIVNRLNRQIQERGVRYVGWNISHQHLESILSEFVNQCSKAGIISRDQSYDMEELVDEVSEKMKPVEYGELNGEEGMFGMSEDGSELYFNFINSDDARLQGE